MSAELFHLGWLAGSVNSEISVVYFQQLRSGLCWQFTRAAKDCFTISGMPQLSHYTGIYKRERVFLHFDIAGEAMARRERRREQEDKH